MALSNDQLKVFNEMKHELDVRAQIIKDMQRDMERMRNMLDGSKGTIQRLQDENAMINAQSKAIVKGMFLAQGLESAFISRSTLQKAKFHKLDSEHCKDGAPGIRLILSEMSEEEKENEVQLQQKAEEAQKRITGT